ncbi:MAG: glycine--tRNA ligase subunit beta, partial [Candidatus Regiella insecticola]|nr:glycine--tRNA ligase subunit beta [Candidatus Regiella insecticola]
YEQYLPRFSGDLLPSKPVSCALAIADKIDTLVGIGQLPKGDKDPFALRRTALGVLRIITLNKLPLDLQTLSQQAERLYGRKLINKKGINEVVEFMLGRFRAWYQEEGHSVDTI